MKKILLLAFCLFINANALKADLVVPLLDTAKVNTVNSTNSVNSVNTVKTNSVNTVNTIKTDTVNTVKPISTIKTDHINTVNPVNSINTVSPVNMTKTSGIDNEKLISNALSDIIFNENEYIKITGKIEQSQTLSNIEIEQSTLSTEKTNLITQRLRTLRNIDASNYMDRFNLYLIPQPKYSTEKSPVVVFDLTDNYMQDAIDKNKKRIKKYYEANYYNIVYTKWVLLNKKYKIDKPLYLKTRVDKNGRILSVKLFKSTGNKAFDDEAIKMMKSCLFDKFNIEDTPYVDLMFKFNENVDIETKIKPYFNNTATNNFGGLLKVVLDKNGNITSINLEKSSGNTSLDNEMISALKKTGNLFEILNFDDKTPAEKYVFFKYMVFKGMKPILKIGYFSPNDDTSASQLELLQYASTVEYLVKKNWIPPSLDTKYEATALFIMNKEGKVTKATIINSSNIPEADNSILRAISTAQLPAIPDDFNSDYVPVEMNFDYEMDPNIDPIIKEIYFKKR